MLVWVWKPGKLRPGDLKLSEDWRGEDPDIYHEKETQTYKYCDAGQIFHISQFYVYVLFHHRNVNKSLRNCTYILILRIF